MLLDPALAFATTLAVVRVADAVALALLLLFALWGLRRGALRQGLSLLVLVAALVLATSFGPSVEMTVAKVTSLGQEEVEAAAWAAVLFASLVAGGVLLSYLCCRLPARADRRSDRLLGALFGGAKGAFILVALLYVAAAVGPTPGATPLSRRAGSEAAPAPRAPESIWIARLRGSISAQAMAAGAAWCAGVLELPVWIDRRRMAVDSALSTDAAPARRPRER